MDNTVKQLYARFIELAERAEHETKRYGAPYGETQMALETLNGIFTATDTMAAQEMRRHNAFLRTLREGYSSKDARLVTLMADVDPEWETLPLTADADADASKAMTVANDATGGYLASSTFAADLLRAMATASPVRQVVTVVPVRGIGQGSKMPVRSGIQTASRVSETAERVSTSGNLSFKLDQVPVHEMYTMTALSRHVLADSEYPLDRELVDGATQAFRVLEGTEFVSGDAVGKMQGLNSADLPTANKITCADSSGHTVTPDDILKLVYKSVAAPYIAGARLILNPKLLGTLRGLKATSGASYLAPVQDRVDTFMGIPVVLMPDLADNATPAAGNVVAYFIHPLSYALVVREEVVVQRLVERYAELGQVGFMVRSRTGGQVVLPEAVARLTTA